MTGTTADTLSFAIRRLTNEALAQRLEMIVAKPRTFSATERAAYVREAADRLADARRYASSPRERTTDGRTGELPTV